MRFLSIIFFSTSCFAGDLYKEIETDDIKQLVSLANQGDPIALTKLGVIVHAGMRGTQADDTYSLECFTKAAALDFPPALNELGYMHAGGHGVTKNVAVAFNFYLRAAKLGHARAMDTIGYLYKSGEGVPRNYIEAYRWSTLAAARNIYGADLRVNELEKIMTPSERMEAQRSALETNVQVTARQNTSSERTPIVPAEAQIRKDSWLRTFIYRYEVEIVVVLFVVAFIGIILVLTPSNKKPAASKREEKQSPSFLKYWAITTSACFTIWAFLGWGNAGMEGLGKAIGAGLIMAPISGFIFGGIYWLIKK